MSDESSSQTPRYVDSEAESVESAIQAGLVELGLTRAEISVEVLDEGGRGVFGLGGRLARVRVTEGDEPYRAERAEPEPEIDVPERQPQAAPRKSSAMSPDMDDDVRIGQDVLDELLAHLNIEANVETRRAAQSEDEHDSPWVLDIQGKDLGMLIGRRGETLNALQYIARLIVNREVQRRANIVIDVEGYKTRRENTLRQLAQRMAEQARNQGRTVKLEPMPPNERRIIHIALRDDPSVTTESEGFGDRRKVTIRPEQPG